MRVRANEKAGQVPYLTVGREYDVIGLDHESYRVIDDKGEPILFAKSVFSVTIDAVPTDWIWDRYADDEYYANPPELHEPGFYEDFFDGKPEAISQFDAYVKKQGVSAPCRMKDFVPIGARQ